MTNDDVDGGTNGRSNHGFDHHDAIERYAVDGERVRTVELPVERPSSMAFGGTEPTSADAR